MATADTTTKTPGFARARHIIRRACVFAAAFATLAGLLLYGLLHSEYGRDLLLGRIVANLPAGSTLTWARAEGPLAGPMALHDVRFEYRACPDRGGKPVVWPACGRGEQVTVFIAKQVAIDPMLRALIGKCLQLDTLSISEAVLTLPYDDAPFELPRWPQSLPLIDPPLALEVEEVLIERMRVMRTERNRTTTSLIELHRVSGEIEADRGWLHLERVLAETSLGVLSVHGDYVPRDRYHTDLNARLLLPAIDGRAPERFGITVRGDLHKLDVSLAGGMPAPLKARLVLEGESDPRWRFEARTDALQLSSLLGEDDDSTYAFDLRAEGKGGHAAVQGRIAQGDTIVEIMPSNIAIENQVLTLSPLVVKAFGGTLSAKGRADFSTTTDPSFDGTVHAHALRWQGAAKDAVAVEADGDFKVAGRLRAWTAQGSAVMSRGSERANVNLMARGDDTRAIFETLRVRTPNGRLDGAGKLWWSPSPRWQADVRLAGFDPGYFLPDWRGAVNGRLRTEGETRRDGGINAQLDAETLGGNLRGRALGGRAHVVARLAAQKGGRSEFEGDIALRLGASSIDAAGRIGDTMDINAKLSPLQLSDVLPGGEGVLSGQLRMSGARAQPNLDVDLAGTALRYDDWKAEALRAKGRLPWHAGTAGALRVNGEGVDAGLILSRLRLDVSGAVEALSIDGNADTRYGAIVLQGDLARRGTQWHGHVSTLRLAPTIGPAWGLQAPANFSATPSSSGLRLQMAESCFATADRSGSLCADVDWPTRADIHAAALPLDFLSPYLPERRDRHDWRLRGMVDVDATFRPHAGSWAGSAQVRATNGGLAREARSRREILAYSDLRIDATFDPQGYTADLDTTMKPSGRVTAHIANGWDPFAPLQGQIDIDTTELAWLELFSPDIVDPQGHLQGRVTLAGTRAQPAFGGQARLSGFRTEMPALALSLRDGDVRMDAQADGTAHLAGAVRSGEGTLRVDGTLGWLTEDTPLRLTVRGENVLISDTRELRAVIDPNVLVSYAAGQPIVVSGDIRVRSAKMDLERLDKSVSASDDVVVLDPANPLRSGRTSLDLDLALTMSDDVRLHGFGLDGSLGGSVRMRARPGRETVATGSLDVEGRYTAYGQKLQITRGRLLWSNTAFADPVIDIRAERQVGTVVAGIDVKGRASAPEAEIWSNPATSESEALAYLALGRPLSSANADENRELSAATAALSAGNLLASQLGSKIGLDDAGISESRILGGGVVGVGKYLSPRLYVSYGVSLIGTGQIITLKYMLRKGFDIEIQSSTVENRGSVNWRKEK